VSAATDRPLALLNARIVDPASGLDARGALFIRNGGIEAVVTNSDPGAVGADYETLDAAGALLIPGLVDLRAKTGEPGFETRETLRSASEAAAAGGVTTFVVQPDTDPVIDEASVVDFIRRRARDSSLVNILPAGAATQGCAGERMAEIGLMAEAGCVYVTDADRPIVNSKVMRRVLAYAKGFGMLVAHRPSDPWLSEGAAATSGEFAGRMGLPSAPPEAAPSAIRPSGIVLPIALSTSPPITINSNARPSAATTMRYKRGSPEQILEGNEPEKMCLRPLRIGIPLLWSNVV
jgi:dihydroorotase